MFIYTNAYAVQRKMSIRFIRDLSSLLGLNPINISLNREPNVLKMPEVDLNLYEKYKYFYLTSKESENKFSRDIVIKTLRDLAI